MPSHRPAVRSARLALGKSKNPPAADRSNPTKTLAGRHACLGFRIYCIHLKLKPYRGGADTKHFQKKTIRRVSLQQLGTSFGLLQRETTGKKGPPLQQTHTDCRSLSFEGPLHKLLGCLRALALCLFSHDCRQRRLRRAIKSGSREPTPSKPIINMMKHIKADGADHHDGADIPSTRDQGLRQLYFCFFPVGPTRGEISWQVRPFAQTAESLSQGHPSG